MTYAVIDSSGLVVNTVLWNGKPPWQPPEGCTAIRIPNDLPVGIGWTYANGQFVAPEPLASTHLDADNGG